MKDHNPELSSKCMEIVECDVARIRQFQDGKMFLIIGFNRNTKDDLGQSYRNYDFEKGGLDPIPDRDYVEEKVVASGETESELIKSAERYKKLCGMTMLEFLAEGAYEIQSMG